MTQFAVCLLSLQGKPVSYLIPEQITAGVAKSIASAFTQAQKNWKESCTAWKQSIYNGPLANRAFRYAECGLPEETFAFKRRQNYYIPDLPRTDVFTYVRIIEQEVQYQSTATIYFTDF